MKIIVTLNTACPLLATRTNGTCGGSSARSSISKGLFFLINSADHGTKLAPRGPYTILGLALASPCRSEQTVVVRLPDENRLHLESDTNVTLFTNAVNPRGGPSVPFETAWTVQRMSPEATDRCLAGRFARTKGRIRGPIVAFRGIED